MSKSKSSSKGSKPARSDTLTKVKDAAITKPAQSIKAKSKDLAKQVAAKEEKKEKKSKKKAKEPTPEPSDSEESESSESSESEGEEETKKPVGKGKTNGAKKAAPVDDSESEGDSESDSEVEAPKSNGANKKATVTKSKAKEASDASDSESDSDESTGGAAPAAKAASSDEDSDGDSSDESSEDEKPVEKVVNKVAAVGEVLKDNVKKAVTGESGSEAESDSDSSEDSEDEKEVTAKPPKRKYENEDEQAAKKSKTEAPDTSKGANLFVGNLSWNVDEAWLREVFEEFGELSGVRIVTDRDSGRSKGFGYVEFVKPEDAAAAHSAKAGSELDGRNMNVDFANARPDKSQQQENRRKSYGDQVGEASDTLFLGNLSFDVGQEAVTEAFAPHGTIMGIRLPTDRETGQPKGFGYVTFSSIDESKAALEAMQGAYIEGRPLRLDYSTPRPQNSDSPARGRGGFGGGFGGRGGPRGGARGGRGGRGGGGFGGRGGRGGGRGGSTNRGGFGDFSGRKTSFD